jgi:hypothetical protein
VPHSGTYMYMLHCKVVIHVLETLANKVRNTGINFLNGPLTSIVRQPRKPMEFALFYRINFHEVQMYSRASPFVRIAFTIFLNVVARGGTVRWNRYITPDLCLATSWLHDLIYLTFTTFSPHITYFQEPARRTKKRLIHVRC